LLPPVSPCTWQTFVPIFDIYGRSCGVSILCSSIDAEDREHALTENTFAPEIERNGAPQEVTEKGRDITDTLQIFFAFFAKRSGKMRIYRYFALKDQRRRSGAI